MNLKKLKRTSNIERRTSNVEVKTKETLFTSTFDVRRSMFDVRICILSALLLTTASAIAQDAPKPHRPLPSLLQWEASGAQRDPLMGIDHHMGNIVDDLSDQKTDQPVQSQQKQVVSDLDVMIKQLEEQMKSGGSGKASMNPTKPANKSTLAKGPGGSGPLHDPRAGTRDWNSLSPKEREQIMQSQTEGFPPGYEAVLSSYYKRLAQEKVDAENISVQGPSTRPGVK